MTAKLVTVSLDQIKPATAVVILTSNVEEVELVRAKVSGEDLMSEWECVILYDTTGIADYHEFVEITTDLDRIREGIEVAGASIWMSQQEGEDSSSEEEEKQEEIETPAEKQEKEVKEEANIEKSVPEVTPSQDMEEELEQFD